MLAPVFCAFIYLDGSTDIMVIFAFPPVFLCLKCLVTKVITNLSYLVSVVTGYMIYYVFGCMSQDGDGILHPARDEVSRVFNCLFYVGCVSYLIVSSSQGRCSDIEHGNSEFAWAGWLMISGRVRRE